MIPACSIVRLDSEAGAHLVASLRQGEVTALVGSGVSGFAPTRLPTGMAVGRAIAERLAEGGVSRREMLTELLSETAFEQVMERCPRPERVRDVLSRRFRDVPANKVHRAFALLTGSGVIRHLVTTNYDVGLEAAFRDAAPSASLTMVRDSTEAEHAEPDAPHVLFKIHGCATVPFAREMAFRLTDEAQLPEWKRAMLRRLVASRTLLVVAYSGMDFEICPELPRMGAARLVWLHYGPLEWMTPNAWRVVQEAGGVVLQGSAQALAGALMGEGEVVADWAPGTAEELARDLFAGFGEEDLDAWRARLFGEIGCGRDAEAAADRMLEAAELRDDGGARARALARRGQGRFHQGRYVEAAADYARAARLARRSGNLHDLREALNGVVECNRCAGRLGRTVVALGALGAFVRRARGTPEHAPARTDEQMRRLVLGRHAYQLASRIPERRGLRRLRERLQSAIRERARRDLGEVSAFAAEIGNWMMLQQTMLWAGRYDLPWEEVFQGSMNPLPSRTGYRQLGYVVAHSMAIRDEGRAPDPAELEKLLTTLAEVGAAPEAWKLARLAVRWLGPSAVPGRVRAHIEEGWRRCQITPRRRRAMEREFRTEQGIRAERPARAG